MAYYKTRNAGTRKTGGTPRNRAGTTEHSGTLAEHPGIPTENQRNTGGTPRNNGTIQNEEQLSCFFKKN